MNKIRLIVVATLLGCIGALGWLIYQDSKDLAAATIPVRKTSRYEPRIAIDSSGFVLGNQIAKAWKDPTSLEEMRDSFASIGISQLALMESQIASKQTPADTRLGAYMFKATMLMFNGKAAEAYQVLEQTRQHLNAHPALATKYLQTVIFFQGVAGLRRGENENCLECRGDGACVFPISKTAVHTKSTGSRLAIQHFTEYLNEFPDDLGVRWLLNLAYMTLGEYPGQVPAQYLLKFDDFGVEFNIGKFKDVSHVLGLTRMNEAGGAIMEDFDNDGLLDLVVTSSDPTQVMAFYRNNGDGTFVDRTEIAGLGKQYGGLNCVQTDYNNDGFADIFVVRGAWLKPPYVMRPSLLRNNGNGTFTDVTREAGLMDPLNSISATWADYDNDGFLDVYICNETGPNRLYRNRGNGTFEEVAARANVTGRQKHSKGAAWIDYDNDGYPDLFVNSMDSTAQLFHNNRNGTFTDVTDAMGIQGPKTGFSCWAFDYDNDGWIDIFATCFDRTLDDVVADMLGKPAVTAGLDHTRLYRNMNGRKFIDVSKETGVNKVFSTMGSNFADFDNDGYLDFYLSTGEPQYSSLVPNRMFKNVAGKRFAEITTTSGTGHLQKGHGVACGDWNRDGHVDLFAELGGAVPGDRYHNVMFQNPGQGNNWLVVKLVGKKTNRPALGARIKAVTASPHSLTVHRHVSSGSSFGANAWQQHLGLGNANAVTTLEITWPTSGTTQTFHNIKVNQAIEITEFNQEYRPLSWTPIQLPKE